jgi:ABC-2 type transport system ATP-binding protein
MTTTDDMSALDTKERHAIRPVEKNGKADWIIRTRGISKSYRGAQRKAVDSLDLEIEKATIFGLLGPNGAGKTTTLSMLCGLLAPDSGTVELAPGTSRTELRKTIGYVPQDLALYPRLTARENLAFFGSLYQVSGERLRARIDALLDLIGLSDRAGDKVQTYSTGMQRRLNLALGLIHEPRILLLDEPTVGIDPQSRNCIFEAVLELRKHGTSILYTTHYMEEASRLCDRIAIMDEGRIILEGDPREAVRRHGLTRMEFQVDGDGIEDAVASVERIVSRTSRDGVLAISIASGEDAMTVARAVVDAGLRRGIAVSLSSVQEPNLESLFLDLTGKSLRDVA